MQKKEMRSYAKDAAEEEAVEDGSKNSKKKEARNWGHVSGQVTNRKMKMLDHSADKDQAPPIGTPTGPGAASEEEDTDEEHEMDQKVELNNTET